MNEGNESEERDQWDMLADMNILKLHTTSDDVSREIGYALIGRAQEIHDNPNDEHEEIAEELRDIGQQVIEQYEE